MPFGMRHARGGCPMQDSPTLPHHHHANLVGHIFNHRDCRGGFWFRRNRRNRGGDSEAALFCISRAVYSFGDFRPADSPRLIMLQAIPLFMINWAITFCLLSLVSGIFVFGGTLDTQASLLGRVAAIGFLVCALVTFVIRRRHRDLR